MKVKFNTVITGSEVYFRKGQIKDLPEMIAQGYIDAGAAVEVIDKPVEVVKEVIETTVAEVVQETTAKPTPQKRGRKSKSSK